MYFRVSNVKAGSVSTRLRRWRQDRREEAGQSARNVERIKFLRSFIPPQGTGAELGVHKGYFSRALYDFLAPEKFYLIDPWYLQGNQWPWGDGNRNVMDALCGILHRMERELVSGKVILLIDDDLKALAGMPNRHLDWAYLDTTHQYEQTKNELQLLKVKMKPDGVIAGDDWQPDPSHRHHGVCQALWEFIDREKWKLLSADETTMQWAIRAS